MHRFIALMLLFSLSCLMTAGQTATYKKLLDTAVSASNSVFVNAKPITAISLDKTHMWDYYNNYIEDSKLTLDTVMFAQIVQNAGSADNTAWKDSELSKSILIKSREEPVDINYVTGKFNLTDNRQIKAYKKIISTFNATRSPDKNIYNYSRPVFDNSKQFAIIQWDNGHGSLAGAGGIILYHFTDDSWEELGSVMTWNY